MIALTYGAYLDPQSKTLNKMLFEGTSCFCKDPEIRHFNQQVNAIRNISVKKATRKNGQAINHLGKPLELANSDVDNNTIFAYILYGLEAQMLHDAIKRYSNVISLLSYDGFVTRIPINVNSIEQDFEYQTGLKIKLKTTQLAA